MRIRIGVPAPEGHNLDTVYDTLSRRNIIDLIQHSLSEPGLTSVSRNWKNIIEPELRAGKKLEFAWRFGGQLDWVWQERDVEGYTRPWDILSGVSLCQVWWLVMFPLYVCLTYVVDSSGTAASAPRVAHCGTYAGFRSPPERKKNVRTASHRRLSQSYQAAKSSTGIPRHARWKLVFPVTTRCKASASAECAPLTFDVRAKAKRGGI